jgi:AcrR family transcriptional regulator
MSNSNAQTSVSNKRSYRLGKRAEAQEATRRRIVEAAVKLHGSVGPAQTTVSQISELAGVQRHTYYAHFPEERDLFLACSGWTMEKDPLPEPQAWADIPAGRQRLAAGLAQIYGWYDRNAEMAACVLRDAEHHALTREMIELRMGPTFACAEELLGKGLSARGQALLGIALQFFAWRSLCASHSPESAADLMAEAVLAVS